MRKITLLIISSFLTLGLITGCSTKKETNKIPNKEQISTNAKEQDIREIAYNQLTSKDKERIAGTWQDSSLSKIILHWIEGVTVWDKLREYYIRTAPYNIMPTLVLAILSTSVIIWIKRLTR